MEAFAPTVLAGWQTSRIVCALGRGTTQTAHESGVSTESTQLLAANKSTFEGSNTSRAYVTTTVLVSRESRCPNAPLEGENRRRRLELFLLEGRKSSGHVALLTPLMTEADLHCYAKEPHVASGRSSFTFRLPWPSSNLTVQMTRLSNGRCRYCPVSKLPGVS